MTVASLLLGPVTATHQHHNQCPPLGLVLYMCLAFGTGICVLPLGLVYVSCILKGSALKRHPSVQGPNHCVFESEQCVQCFYKTRFMNLKAE